MLKDFVIPLNKDELLISHAGQYNVEQILPPNMVSKAVEATQRALEMDGACFILTCFDTFFSVLLHSNKLELRCILLSFKRVFKGVKILVADMEKIFDQGKEIEEEERPKLLCLNKMFAYLISQITCHIDQRIVKNSNTIKHAAQRKKNTKTDEEAEWDDERQKLLELIYRWLQLPLQKIWKPPIVEESFVTTLSQVCYSVLEHCTDAKQKHTRQTIFEILGTLSKKYNHGIICIVRIVQLVKLYDTLPAYIATGVVHMDIDCGCNGFLKQVIKEIGQTELVEAESRNISIFLDNIALLKPDVMLPIIDDILEYLASEYYTMRNCAIGIIGTVIQKVLTSEHLTPEQKEQRDECFKSLYEHMLDCNAYVRSKVLQVWQNLCCEGSIPLSRQTELLTACMSRLQDKSAIVRKQALQLLRTLLQSNPFAAKLDEVEFLKSMEREKIKLKELQSQFTSDSARGDNERLELWNTLLPDIRKAIENVIDNHNEKENREDVTDSEKGENEDVDPNYAFEKIRQLILKEKVSKAVSYLWRVCTKLQDAPKIQNLSPETQEECLFAFLFKIFIESEGGNNKNNEQKASVEENISSQYKEQKEEIKAKKRLVDYLKHCTEFATKLKDAIPLVEALLFSTTASDAVEACTLLGIASQFGVTGANAAMRKALLQAFHRDESVRRNLAIVYKQLYLDDTDSQAPPRQKANSCVKSLIHLVKELQPGQSPALEELIVSWYNNKEISEETLQILWEKFSMKSTDTTPIESRAALMLIMMISKAENKIITDNLHVLVKIGLGPRAKTDLLLARDTCRILQKIDQSSINIEIAPIRYLNGHDIFRKITALLTENFCELKENGYISFATDAINVIYKLADNPHYLIKSFLLDILERGQFTAKHDNQVVVVSSIMLSNLLYLVGHIAIKEMVYLDIAVYKEIKRRNIVKELKKNKNSNKNGMKHYKSLTGSVSLVMSSSSKNVHNKESSILQEDNGEDALEGAEDDADAELINTVLESEIVTGNGLLTKFVPIVLDVCQQPEKYKNENLQAAGTLALCKMMTVSSVFCKQYLQLLVTILERSAFPKIRANVLIGLSDLITRFPNEVEPWTKHIYGRLQDKDRHVRSTCVRVLSNLIMREMVRVKGQVAELALCIIDEDIQIQQDTKHFFEELSQRGYALYNIIPDILSRLSDPQLNLSESNFQEILGYILGLVQKEKQIEALIEKICARFKLATTERLWCDLSYCLSVLQFSAKSMRHLIESLPVLKDKIHHKQVLKTLQGIIDHTKKKPDAKDICLELEEKIKELLTSENIEMNDNILMLPPPTLPQKKKLKVNRKNSEKEDENSSDSDSDPPVIKKNLTSRNAKKKSYASNVPSDSSSESDDANSREKSSRIQSQKTRLSTTKMKSKLKHSDLSPSTRSPLAKKNRSSKAGETPTTASSQTLIKTPVQRATRTTRSSARLSELQK